MSRASVQSIREAFAYQLDIVKGVLLALLAREPSYAYQLRAALALALGPLGRCAERGQVYVTLTRLEKAGLVSLARVEQTDRPDRKMCEPTSAGRDRVMSWLEAERAALAQPDGSVAALLVKGVVLRLQADLRWLEACARYWNSVKER